MTYKNRTSRPARGPMTRRLYGLTSLALSLSIVLALAGCGSGRAHAASSPGTASKKSAVQPASAQSQAMQSSAMRGSAAQDGSRQGQQVPDWMKVSATARQVDLSITAAATTTNSGFNFNGYANGGMTVVVPKGWKVKITFQSRDASVPHSVGVVDTASSFPADGDHATLAFSGASVVPYSAGILAGKTQSFDFTANTVGKYWLMCGVPGHAMQGMWDYFVVSGSASSPYVEYAHN